MDSRRDFLKRAAIAALGSGGLGGLPPVIQRALAIDPAPGTTWLDAEHVVILMQENRSFDHCYGTLRGVRGFNDPRAVVLPNGLPVWCQSNHAGETYVPFRLDIHDTRATWMSSLPHSWVDQIDARAEGRHDGWLEAKRSGREEYSGMPLTLGYYDRRDIPFYYALADAFTVCDQNFCSSLTGTTPNRLHLWTGTVRAQPSSNIKANIRNEDVDYGREAAWKTFPERLEALGVSWRIYQNELSIDSGLGGEADAWLANFTDNPLEWFSQYQLRFSPSRRRYMAARERALPAEIEALEMLSPSASRDRQLATARAELESVRRERERYSDAQFAALPSHERQLHERAFTTNSGDPDYRSLESLAYEEGGARRQMQAPKGDVLHQFREDVQHGRLPSVSWIVAPQNFSDHPGAPWYGAWFLSECLDILTRNPEVWRKTLFILCYDENDGYFDHVPPFVPPDPTRPASGRASRGLDSPVEWVFMTQEDERAKTHPEAAKRSGPIGLGFRVPLVIASPWSRGGYVNSEISDHTSILRLLENLLTHRLGRPVREPNISAWRRAVCGDLRSVFRPYHGETFASPDPLRRDTVLAAIHQAQFRPLPAAYRRLSPADLIVAKSASEPASWMPRQEVGIRPSCSLPYELDADAVWRADQRALRLQLAARRQIFGDHSAGAPFHAYIPGPGRPRAYAVSTGDVLTDDWAESDFTEGRYDLRVHGPNGFYREFRGTPADPRLEIGLIPVKEGDSWTGNAGIKLHNSGSEPLTVRLTDRSYGRPERLVEVPAGDAVKDVTLDLASSFGWYDVEISIRGLPEFVRRYAGRIETGREGFSDPLMGRVAV